MLYKVTTEDYKSFIAKGKYRKSYRIGELVKADSKTLGLMLFKTKERSRKFARTQCMFNGTLLILGVESEDKATALQEKLCIFSDEKNLDYFYSSHADLTEVEGPAGTVCCYSLRVLKEIEKINWRDV